MPRDLTDMPLGEHETESPDPRRIEITRPNGALWKLTAFYANSRVSSSWHRTRAEALKEAQSFA